MSRGKAYNIWKGRLKYVSRLKHQMYFWIVKDGKKRSYNGTLIDNYRKPNSWKELDEKGGHSKLLKKTPSMHKKSKWEKVYDRNYIKDLREESRKIIDEQLKDENNDNLHN